MWTSGMANTVVDLFTAVDSILTSVGWARYDYAQTKKVYTGVGRGTDKIYLQLNYIIAKKTGRANDRIFADGPAGFDAELAWTEQPGSIMQQLDISQEIIECSEDKDETQLNIYPIPCHVITPDERFFYWLFCDTYRLIIVTRHSTVYESSYFGFINPIASERQYPYPMYICGNGLGTGPAWKNNETGAFIFPDGQSGWLRLIDGVWRDFAASKDEPLPSSKGTVFPYTAHNKKLIPNYKESDAINQDNFLLIPIILQTNNPTMMAGYLRGCYWISGTRDIDTERILVLDGRQYMVFDTKDLRSPNSYFAIAME